MEDKQIQDTSQNVDGQETQKKREKETQKTYQKQKTVLKSVDDWAKEKCLKPSVVAGVRLSQGWAKGKLVSGKEFEVALKNFMDASIRGV